GLGMPVRGPWPSRHSECALIPAVGFSSATLIPLDEREVLRPWEKPVPGNRTQRIARPAMQDEQHRVVAALALNAYPLLDPTHPGEQSFIDPLCRIDRPGPGDSVVPVCAVSKGTAQPGQNEPKQADPPQPS